MTGLLRIGAMITAGSLLLPLVGCSRTSDGTIVVEKPAALPSFNLIPVKPIVPSWMKRKPDPEPVAEPNFPPPPASRAAAPKRKTRPPVVTSGSGKLACKNVSQGGRVRMVCG